MSRKRKILVSLLTVVGLTAAYFFACSYTIYLPIAFDEARLNPAVAWVRANRNTSTEGAIALAPRFAFVSATGKAYINRNIIFFPSLVGRRTLLPDPFHSDADWTEGYGFSNIPLPTQASEPLGSDKCFCLVNFSDPAFPTPDSQQGDNGRQMAVDSRISKHWYAINSFS